MNKLKNQILVQKYQEIYIFYLLKTISWAEDRRLNSWFGDVEEFALLLDKAYKINERWDISLNNPFGEQFRLNIKRRGGSIKREYFLEKHPTLESWWIVEINRKDDFEKLNDLEMLIKDFCHTVSLSHRSGKEFQEACSFYLEKQKKYEKF